MFTRMEINLKIVLTVFTEIYKYLSDDVYNFMLVKYEMYKRLNQSYSFFFNFSPHYQPKGYRKWEQG